MSVLRLTTSWADDEVSFSFWREITAEAVAVFFRLEILHVVVCGIVGFVGGCQRGYFRPVYTRLTEFN